MTSILIIEDGTGLANANAYIDSVFADNYFSLRNVPAWTGTQLAKEQAIINAMDYIEGRFGRQFIGVPKFPDVQALSFPRKIPNTTSRPIISYPYPIIQNTSYIDISSNQLTYLYNAVCEYALRALSSPLAPDPVMDETGLRFAEIREKVGPIDTQRQFAFGSTPSLFRPYPKADFMIARLLNPTGGAIRA